MLSEFTGTLKKDIRLTQTHINQGYQITKDWNVQKKNSFWMPSKRKGKKNKEENILWKAHYLTSRLSHWKPFALAFASQWNVSLCECRIGEPSHSSYQSYQLIN